MAVIYKLSDVEMHEIKCDDGVWYQISVSDHMVTEPDRSKDKCYNKYIIQLINAINNVKIAANKAQI